MSNHSNANYTLPFRDDYGRSAHQVYAPVCRQIGRIVRLPKVAIENRGDGMKYLSNDWSMKTGTDPQAGVAYHRTLGEARARFAAINGCKR